MDDGEERGDVVTEMDELAHHATADTRQLRRGEEEDGLDAREAMVDIGLLALVLKVFHAPHSLDDEGGTLATDEVDGEVGIACDTHALLMSIELTDGFHSLLSGEHGLLAFVHAHTDNQPVEEGQRATDNGLMANGEGVE